MKDLSPFKLILIVVFVGALLLSILLFSGILGGGSSSTTQTTGTGSVVMWGTVKQELIQPAIDEALKGATYQLTYIQKDPATFDADFLNALAEGHSPDLVLLPDNLIWYYRNKLTVIPYASYPERTYLDTFVDGASVFLGTDGMFAFPFSVDPMVLYYNKSMLSGAGIPKPPKYWSEVLDMSPFLTHKDTGGNITQSTISFGRYENVTNAKDMLALLFMQTGNSITYFDRQKSLLHVTLGDDASTTAGGTGVSASYGLDFFTSFANPTAKNYSWNRAMSNDTTAFLGEQLAFYPGYASEVSYLRDKNPNLDFDVTFMPQTSISAKDRITFGRFMGMAIPKGSQNQQAAFTALGAMTSTAFQTKLSTTTLLPPIRKDMYVPKPTDPFMVVFYDSALQAHSWLDPNKSQSDTIFSDMVNTVVSGARDSGAAVLDASNKLKTLVQ